MTAKGYCYVGLCFLTLLAAPGASARAMFPESRMGDSDVTFEMLDATLVAGLEADLASEAAAPGTAPVLGDWGVGTYSTGDSWTRGALADTVLLEAGANLVATLIDPRTGSSRAVFEALELPKEDEYVADPEGFSEASAGWVLSLAADSVALSDIRASIAGAFVAPGAAATRVVLNLER